MSTTGAPIEQEASSQEATPEPASSVWRWWKSLASEDRAGRAELRRCGTVGDVAFTASYHRLLQWLGSRLGEGDARRVAVAAAVLAHVEKEPRERTSLASQMARPKGDAQGAAVSDARFRHLLRNEEPDDMLRELVRAVRQLDRSASVDRLFIDVVRWDERTRSRWARDYYEALPSKKKA
ncbi:type I-E CRISPR-associated protein Cse2/CasB [Anaeromyxobacter sp. PSR-1]|uniref:type I-E CRISPR-associated protein Cse2/CasB n=1 Tax=unclassified Anaeromyxobacter TaxID=2620896 RepID=UPI0005E0ECB6|nr:type I-E CRISPR-associated protein Cse2/CasB [Anaeromyxobacter sp. PSR-1]GAO03219.1 CRISPR-associated protein Cse2 [Anaeromyxobacter sp. PSR-1]